MQSGIEYRNLAPGTGRRAASVSLALAVVLVSMVVVPASAQAQNYKILHRFRGSRDGTSPYYAGVIFDARGNLYGVDSNRNNVDLGQVYKLEATGKLTVFSEFPGGAGGGQPYGNLVVDTKGNFYGTTKYGGHPNCNGDPTGCGVVYKLDTTGKETVLHTFAGKDGAEPVADLVLDAKGNLYGTTESGGDYSKICSPPYEKGCGVVFKVSSAGKYTVLHTFTSADGASPGAPLILDAKGNLYGTTQAGGDQSLCGGQGCGVCFKMSSKGKETVLYKFTGSGDGALPWGNLILDAKGNLYGTTWGGGSYNHCETYGCGTVFKLSSTGKHTVLHSFGLGADGQQPQGRFVKDANGNLYGATLNGGTYGAGVVFKASTTGKYSVLHNFGGGKDGQYPTWGVTMDAQGNLYGTTLLGGDFSCGQYGCGTVFKLMP